LIVSPEFDSQKLKYRVSKLLAMLRRCTLCPRNCLVDRVNGDKGYCNAGLNPAVYSYGPHNGEEPPLSGTSGAGTIFFTHCNMSCVYCQNFEFSQLSDAGEISVSRLADIMLELEDQGCHNINLVSPTHYAPQIIESACMARRRGMKLPFVYNTGGYDSFDTIRLLDGLIDIYLPDMRYGDDRAAYKYSNANGYVFNNRKVVEEMYRQVGDLVIDRDGLAISGLIVRCLVLPDNMSQTEETIEFIAEKISRATYISLMSQYYPVYKASEYEEISCRVSDDNYIKCVKKMRELGLFNGWLQCVPSGMDISLGGHRITQSDLNKSVDPFTDNER